MQTPTDLGPLKRVRHLTLIFAISSWIIENERMFLILISIIINRVKFNYSLRTTYRLC